MRVAIIPARAGSRRIPGKNKRLFHGKPIIQYTIDIATEEFDYTIVTTDDEDIANLALDSGATLVDRPPALAVDEVGTQIVARHALLQAMEDILRERYENCALLSEVDLACVIYPTAGPLIDRWQLRLANRYFRVEQEQNRHPDFVFSVGTRPLRDAGQWYWGTIDAFIGGKPLIGVNSRMWPLPEGTFVDINTPEEWSTAEALYDVFHEQETGT